MWVGRRADSDAPLCHVTDHAVKCFGKNDGIPISPIDSLLADGNGGLWLGGQTALVHWRAGVSETYHVKAPGRQSGPWSRRNSLGRHASGGARGLDFNN